MSKNFHHENLLLSQLLAAHNIVIHKEFRGQWVIKSNFFDQISLYLLEITVIKNKEKHE